MKFCSPHVLFQPRNVFCNRSGIIILTILHNQAEIFVADHIEHLEYLANQNLKLAVLLSGYALSLRLKILIIIHIKKQKCIP